MDKDALIARLVAEFYYPPKGAALVADKILACAPDLQKAFTIWWEGGELPVVEVEGYTMERLMLEHGMNPFAALLTLDFLRREPQRALISLRKGHDRAEFKNV